jgi:hypothetical protein
MRAGVGVTSTSERGELGVEGTSFTASAFSGGAGWLAASGGSVGMTPAAALFLLETGLGLVVVSEALGAVVLALVLGIYN